MLDLYAGFDGGGSGTTCVLADGRGRVLGRGAGGPLNDLFCGKERAAASVTDSLCAAFVDAGLPESRLRAAFVATAAVEVNEGGRRLGFFTGLLDAEQVFCNSDVYPLWFSADEGDGAVVAVAGTGGVCYCLDAGGYLKADGWGPDLGDDGSGYALGLAAARAALQMADGRRERDEAFQAALLQHYGVQTARQLARLLRGPERRRRIASAARCVCGLCGRGNPVARRLVQETADAIVLSVETVLRRRGGGAPLPVVLAGGLLAPDGPVYALVRAALAANPAVRSAGAPGRPAAESAALLAIRLAHGARPAGEG